MHAGVSWHLSLLRRQRRASAAQRGTGILVVWHAGHTLERQQSPPTQACNACAAQRGTGVLAAARNPKRQQPPPPPPPQRSHLQPGELPLGDGGAVVGGAQLLQHQDAAQPSEVPVRQPALRYGRMGWGGTWTDLQHQLDIRQLPAPPAAAANAAAVVSAGGRPENNSSSPQPDQSTGRAGAALLPPRQCLLCGLRSWHCMCGQCLLCGLGPLLPPWQCLLCVQAIQYTSTV